MQDTVETITDEKYRNVYENLYNNRGVFDNFCNHSIVSVSQAVAKRSQTPFIPENSSDDMKREREEKKRYLLRKLSFRPTVNELKDRKVSIN